MKLKKYINSSLNRNNYKKDIKNIVCINCGEVGHIYKKCSHPIQSFGIICIKINDIDINDIKEANELLNQYRYLDILKEKILKI